MGSGAAEEGRRTGKKGRSRRGGGGYLTGLEENRRALKILLTRVLLEKKEGMSNNS